MVIELNRFTEAYATMTIAAYQPLIVKWVSGWSILVAADTMAWRLAKAKHINLNSAFTTAQALSVAKIRPKWPRRLKDLAAGSAPTAPPTDLVGGHFQAGQARPIELEGSPDADTPAHVDRIAGWALCQRPTPDLETGLPNGQDVDMQEEEQQ